MANPTCNKKQPCAVCHTACCGSFDCLDCLDEHMTCVIKIHGVRKTNQLYDNAMSLKLKGTKAKINKLCAKCELPLGDHDMDKCNTAEANAEETWYVIQRLKVKV
jgi:hypothetical protein